MVSGLMASIGQRNRPPEILGLKVSSAWSSVVSAESIEPYLLFERREMLGDTRRGYAISLQASQCSSEPSQRLSGDEDLPRLLERPIGRLNELGILEEDVAENGVDGVGEGFHIGDVAVSSSRPSMRRKVWNDEAVPGVEEMVGVGRELPTVGEFEVSERFLRMVQPVPVVVDAVDEE